MEIGIKDVSSLGIYPLPSSAPVFSGWAIGADISAPMLSSGPECAGSLARTATVSGVLLSTHVGCMRWLSLFGDNGQHEILRFLSSKSPCGLVINLINSPQRIPSFMRRRYAYSKGGSRLFSVFSAAISALFFVARVVFAVGETPVRAIGGLCLRRASPKTTRVTQKSKLRSKCQQKSY